MRALEIVWVSYETRCIHQVSPRSWAESSRLAGLRVVAAQPACIPHPQSRCSLKQLIPSSRAQKNGFVGLLFRWVTRRLHSGGEEKAWGSLDMSLK